MANNPYSPPRLASYANKSGWPEIPFGWNVSFLLLVVGIAIDAGPVASRFMSGIPVVQLSTVPILALIAFAQVLMVFAIRWILFRLILRGRASGDLRGIAPVGGVIVIFAMVKLIEFQGIRLWSATGDLGKYLVFFLPSLVLVVFMTPSRLARFQASGPHFKTNAMKSEAIRS